MTIQYRLREMLAARKMTLRELSRRTGIATSTLTAINTNKTVRIDNATLDKLCVALDCQPGDLIVRIEGPAPGGSIPQVAE